MVLEVIFNVKTRVLGHGTYHIIDFLGHKINYLSAFSLAYFLVTWGLHIGIMRDILGKEINFFQRLRAWHVLRVPCMLKISFSTNPAPIFILNNILRGMFLARQKKFKLLLSVPPTILRLKIMIFVKN